MRLELASARTPRDMRYTNISITGANCHDRKIQLSKSVQDLFGLADLGNPENRKIKSFFFSFSRHFLHKSKNYQHTTVPNGGPRGTHSSPRDPLTTGNNVRKKPLKHL